MLILYFELYVQYNPNKNSRIILLETEKVNLNFIWKHKRSEQTILENLKSRPDTQIYKVHIIKTG